MREDARKRYCRKKYEEAPLIECACGCGRKIKSVNKHGRPKRFVSGHNNRKFASTQERQREWHKANRKKCREAKWRWIRKVKVELIQSKGSRCCDCSREYDGTNAVAFDFHHRDPATKKFNVNTGTMNKMSSQVLKEEAEKCDLICAYCHRLRHGERF